MQYIKHPRRPDFCHQLALILHKFQIKTKSPSSSLDIFVAKLLTSLPRSPYNTKKRRTKLALLPPVSDSLALSASLVGTGRIVKRELQTKHHQAERERWPGNLLLSDWPLAQW